MEAFFTFFRAKKKRDLVIFMVVNKTASRSVAVQELEAVVLVKGKELQLYYLTKTFIMAPIISFLLYTSCFYWKKRQNEATKCVAHEADFKTIQDYSKSLLLSLLNSAAGLNNQTTCLILTSKTTDILKEVLNIMQK